MGAPLGAAVQERNLWPFFVQQVRDEPAGLTTSNAALGPLIYSRQGGPSGNPARGVRPLYAERRTADGRVDEAWALYPLFTYRTQTEGARWSVLNLINRSRHRPVTAGAVQEGFDIWPFYFSRQTGNPDTSYRAVFPLAGNVKHRFGQDRLSWVLFPLYGRFEKNGATTTTTPWPFIKVLRGDGHRGFEFWPLYGRNEKPGVYRQQFYLWPLIYRNERMEGPETTVDHLGVLPFYARDRSPGYRSETFLWPFFGYVDRTAPHRYRAVNYFWPLLVQGRGDDRYVNRWAPFYTHSSIKGLEKTWLLWPVWRQATWTEAGLRHERRQFLFFLYNSNHQHSATRPEAAPASKIHVWPLVSAWDNGAGRRQWQAPSPFEVFFPHNEAIREVWTPLFALYRYNQRAPGEVRHSLLWDGITYEHHQDAGTRSFHLGPLFSFTTAPDEGRVAIGNGLIGLKRTPGTRGWRLFFGDFNARPSPVDDDPAP